jgi:hypothetical protein
MKTLTFACLVAAVAMTSNRQLLADPADPAPVRGLEEVSHARVELRGGFWGPRLATQHEVTIPHALSCLEKDGHVTNFDKAAGARSTAHSRATMPSTLTCTRPWKARSTP